MEVRISHLCVLLLGGLFLSHFVEKTRGDFSDKEQVIESIIRRRWNDWQNNLQSKAERKSQSGRYSGANSNYLQNLIFDAHCPHNEMSENLYLGKRKAQLEEHLNKLRERNAEEGALEEEDTNVQQGSGEIGPIRIVPDYTYVTDRNDPQACYEVGQVVIIGNANEGPCTDQLTDNCQYTCTAQDIQTANLQTMLREVAVPTIDEVFATILSVERPAGNLVLNRAVWDAFQRVCDVGIPIPESYVTVGIPNTDTLIYITARPSSPRTVAYAGACNFDWDRSSSTGIFGRPLAALINFVPRYFQELSSSQVLTPFEFNGLIKVAIHEMTHALGFSTFFYNSYLDPSTGRPYSPPPVNTVEVTGISPAGQTYSHNVSTMTTPKVVATAREYYSCASSPGVELEDFGGGGTAGSHWEMRQVGEEFMAGFVNPQMPISILTLSLFEDMGWYHVNYSAQEYWAWGKGHGCEWLHERCEIGWPGNPGFFCEATNAPGCSPDRKAKAACNVATLAEPIPPYYQHFADPAIGGRIPPADYCPFHQGFIYCDNTGVPGNTAIGEVYGTNSFCFEYTSSFISDMACWPISCSPGGGLSINILGQAIECPAGGGEVRSNAVPAGVVIQCPDPSLICREVSPVQTSGA